MISGGTWPSGVSCPASQTSTWLPPRADSRFAMTEPAEPPPTMM
jgi:hypothetical protein